MGEYRRIEIGVNELLDISKKIFDMSGRLVAINGYLGEENQPRVAYTFEYEDLRETYLISNEKEIPTLTSIYKGAAQWFEEEIEEVMEVKFKGLLSSGRLFLPEEFKDGEGQILVMPLSELKKI